MRTPRTTAAANRLYLQAQALLRRIPAGRIPAGRIRATRARAQAMTLAALRQAAKAQREAGR